MIEKYFAWEQTLGQLPPAQSPDTQHGNDVIYGNVTITK